MYGQYGKVKQAVWQRRGSKEKKYLSAYSKSRTKMFLYGIIEKIR